MHCSTSPRISSNRSPFERHRTARWPHTDHLFLYRNELLCKDLVRNRVQAAGERAGVKVYPHRLGRTCATQLLNAGCRVTSIQKLLGHRRLVEQRL